MGKLNVGDRCPEIKLLDQNGTSRSLSDFAGKKKVIYFYPKALTPGCTIQSKSLRDAYDTLVELGCEVIGISPDQPEKQKRFDEKHDLGFTLLADTDKEVAEAFGVWAEKKMFGKTYMGVVRSSFLVDENDIIQAVWYKISPKNTVPFLLKELKGE